MDISYATERSDIGRIEKLNRLTDISTFWDDVRKFTKHVHHDCTLGKWYRLAEVRYYELLAEYDDKIAEEELDKLYWDTRF